MDRAGQRRRRCRWAIHSEQRVRSQKTNEVGHKPSATDGSAPGRLSVRAEVRGAAGSGVEDGTGEQCRVSSGVAASVAVVEPHSS